ncbi:CHAT domain-containing protein [Russula earlei]|uniref:CHAT domain-containing protein n=1 Tax=Russula earlei TaxID=71964 RepID=A0ACC0UDI2_9AGAM|nr:CHAT domain-containing protein [Russula earlei]
MARGDFHTLNRQQNHHDQDILRYTEAIFVPWDQRPLTIVQAFLQIALALSLRSRESRQSEDVSLCIRYLRCLYEQPLDAFDIPHNTITAALVAQFAFKIELDPGNAISDIEEMANLCHELLNSDISKTILATVFENFANSLVATRSLRRHLSPSPSEKVIECLRDASVCLPDLHRVSIVLAMSLLTRFEITLLNDEYEEGMAIVDKIIAFRGPGDRPSEFQGPALQLVALFAMAESHKCGKVEYREKAIYRFRTLLAGASPEDPVRAVIIYCLTFLRGLRDDSDFGVVRSVDFTHSSRPIPPFRELSASLSQSGSTSRGSALMAMKDQHFDALYPYLRITDMADIKEAINYFRLALPSFHPGTAIATFTALALANALYKAFSCTNNIDYLNESISVLQHSLTITVESFLQFLQARMLIASLSSRFNLLRNEEDLDEIMQVFHVAVNNKHVKTPDRFDLSCKWAKIARRVRHPCTSTAYDCAISLMHDTLTFTPTLYTQHSRLAAVPNEGRILPLDYASHLVRSGRFDQAIETLERGRALLWSEMRGFRTSMDQLRAADSRLADKLAVVNRDLEMLTLTDLSNTDGDSGDGLEGMDQIGLLLLKQRKLLDDRGKLTSRVRSMPGFESFLKAPSFNNLISAASRGPVIVINHSEWRSDIIILHRGSPPSLITTTNDFYHRAIEFRDRLITCRVEHGLDSKRYERVLSSVLGGLYDLVGRPVIEKLRSLNVPEQSRVWWCPTSVFCSLPLHAMGPIPIPSGDGAKRYFFDIYIPSYTPSLSALIESRKPSEKSFEKPSILLVAQPDQSLLSAIPEIWEVNRLDAHVTTLMSSKATPSGVLESLQDHRFSHFACHGNLEYGKPFEASFQLHNGKRLTLLDLIRSPLPTAEFAFLSACHTAELTEGSIADEALHLTAAMQYCGFRSVVGTMWGMADDDGPELVKHFYKSMFSSKQEGTPYYERSARALRDAVRRLRKNRVSLERWVNFVHYGA